MSKPFPKTYETLSAKIFKDHIVHLEFNRPKALNAMSLRFFQELGLFFKDLKEVSDVRVVVLSGSGKHFSAGLDLKEAMSQIDMSDERDQARKGLDMGKSLKNMQKSLLSIQTCHVPVIAAIHGYCIGGAIDLITHCDIRVSEKETQFTIREIDIGMAADIGTLQNGPYVIGNDSFLREMAFTGRFFSAEEALKQGLLSYVLANKEETLKKAFEIAEKIAEKTPVGIVGIKKALNWNRIYKIKKNFDFMRTMNSSNLFTTDMQTAIKATMMKEKPVFPKL